MGKAIDNEPNSRIFYNDKNLLSSHPIIWHVQKISMFLKKLFPKQIQFFYFILNKIYFYLKQHFLNYFST